MNEYTVAAAIATRLGATTAPTGQETIKYASADFPETLSLFPSLIVGVSRMSGGDHVNKRLILPLEFDAAFYLSKADGSPRRSRAVRDWITALYARIAGQVQLGLSDYVALAKITGWTPGATYAGEAYDGAAFVVSVLVEEAVTSAA